MRVVQLLPELNAGGVETGTLETARSLVQAGHESIVISAGGRLVKSLEADGSRHILRPVHKKRLGSLRQVKALRTFFETEKPDVLHLRSRLPAWLAWLACRKMSPQTRPRLVSTVHGFYSVNAYSKIMTCGEVVICVSNSVKNYILKNYPDVPKKKLAVIHRGVDAAKYPRGYRPSAVWLAQWRRDFPQMKGKYLVTLPGRFTRLKGQFDFVKLIAALKSYGLPVHGLLVGETHPRKLGYREKVRAALQSAGLETNCTMLEHRGDLREIMAVSDAVVSCAVKPEAFGRVTLEALSMGRPVVGYDHGGVQEQLDALFPAGKVPVGDTATMSQKLIAWQKNPPVPKKENPFTLESMLSKTLRIYQNLIATTSSSRSD